VTTEIGTDTYSFHKKMGTVPSFAERKQGQNWYSPHFSLRPMAEALHKKGKRPGKTKLIELINRYNANLLKIAEELEVGQATVSRWIRSDPELNALAKKLRAARPARPGKYPGKARLIELINRYKANLLKIAEELNVGRATVSRWIISDPKLNALAKKLRPARPGKHPGKTKLIELINRYNANLLKIAEELEVSQMAVSLWIISDPGLNTLAEKLRAARPGKGKPGKTRPGKAMVSRRKKYPSRKQKRGMRKSTATVATVEKDSQKNEIDKAEIDASLLPIVELTEAELDSLDYLARGVDRKTDSMKILSKEERAIVEAVIEGKSERELLKVFYGSWLVYLKSAMIKLGARSLSELFAAYKRYTFKRTERPTSAPKSLPYIKLITGIQQAA